MTTIDFPVGNDFRERVMGAKSSLFLIVFAHAGIRSFVEAFDDRLLESFEATDGGHIAEDASL